MDGDKITIQAFDTTKVGEEECELVMHPFYPENSMLDGNLTTYADFNVTVPLTLGIFCDHKINFSNSPSLIKQAAFKVPPAGQPPVTVRLLAKYNVDFDPSCPFNYTFTWDDSSVFGTSWTHPAAIPGANFEYIDFTLDPAVISSPGG